MLPREMPSLRMLLLMSSLAALAGCGTKTPLILTPAPAKAPAQAAASPQPASDDSNATRKPQ